MTLLNQSLHPPASTLLSEAAVSTHDPLINTFPLTLIETHKTANKVKAGKAPGSCDQVVSIWNTLLKLSLHHIYTLVWADKVIPEEGVCTCRASKN